MTYIGAAQGYSSTAIASIDATTTLNIAAGDVLVAYLAVVSPDSATLDYVGEDDDTTNEFTVLARAPNWAVQGSYLLSAEASSGATMRMTSSKISNEGWEFTVLQFRPASGETVTFGSGPAAAGTAWGKNPTSLALSTTSADSLYVGAAANDRAAISSNQIGGASPDGTISGTNDFDVSYTVFESAQTSNTYSTATASSGAWGAGLIVLDIATSSGTTYTLDAAGGSYTETGTAADVLFNRLLSVATAGYTQTGTDADVLFNRFISAETAGYTLSGTAAGLLFNRLLTAGTASYTLTGSDVDLLADRKLTADGGTFTETGQVASLLFNRLINAEGSTYALTGTEAGLLYDRLVSAETGTFTLTGTDADLIYSAGYILTAESGTFAQTGTAADLLRSYLTTAEAGAYTLTGQETVLLLDRILNVGSGAYVLTGKDVTFVYSGSTTASGRVRIVGVAIPLGMSGEVKSLGVSGKTTPLGIKGDVLS